MSSEHSHHLISVSVESFTANLLIIDGVTIEKPIIRPVGRNATGLCSTDVLAIITILIDHVIKCATSDRLTTTVVLKTIPLVLFVNTTQPQRVKESHLFTCTW
jgi:hypothetical protein